MHWFKNENGKWYYGDRPYPTHALGSRAARPFQVKAALPPRGKAAMPHGDVARDLDELRKHAMAEAKEVNAPALRKAALAVVNAITDLALDPAGSTDDLKGAIDALDDLARKQGQGSDLAHAARVSQDGRSALAMLQP